MINSSSYSRVMNVSSFNHTNQSMRRGAPFCALPPFTHEVTNVVTWILLVLSFDGNSLIVAAFCTKRLPKTPVNVMIVNMAISDILLLMLEMQNKIADGYLDAGTASFFLCKLPMFLQTTTCNVSTLTMTVIAVDRFYSIVFAVRPPLLSKKSYPAVIAVIWFIAAGSCGHLLYAMKVFAFNNQLFCWFDWSPATMIAKVFKTQWMILFVCFFVVPFIVISIAYFGIITSLHRQTRNLQLGSEVLRQRARENRRVTGMLTTIVMIFFVSWSPLYASRIRSLFFTAERQSCLLTLIVETIPLTYSFLNPIFYYSFNNNYHEAFNSLLCCLCPCIKVRSCSNVSVSPDETSTVRSSRGTEDTRL